MLTIHNNQTTWIPMINSTTHQSISTRTNKTLIHHDLKNQTTLLTHMIQRYHILWSLNSLCHTLIQNQTKLKICLKWRSCASSRHIIYQVDRLQGWSPWEKVATKECKKERKHWARRVLLTSCLPHLYKAKLSASTSTNPLKLSLGISMLSMPKTEMNWSSKSQTRTFLKAVVLCILRMMITRVNRYKMIKDQTKQVAESYMQVMEVHPVRRKFRMDLWKRGSLKLKH